MWSVFVRVHSLARSFASDMWKCTVQWPSQSGTRCHRVVQCCTAVSSSFGDSPLPSAAKGRRVCPLPGLNIEAKPTNMTHLLEQWSPQISLNRRKFHFTHWQLVFLGKFPSKLLHKRSLHVAYILPLFVNFPHGAVVRATPPFHYRTAGVKLHVQTRNSTQDLKSQFKTRHSKQGLPLQLVMTKLAHMAQF